MIVHFARAGVGTPFLLAAAAFERSTGIAVTTVISTRRDVSARPSLREFARRALGRDGLFPRRGAVLRVADVNASAFLDQVPAGAHGVVTYFDQIFAPAAIGRFATLVNFHSSVLPAYRGAQPTRDVVRNGETRTGITVHDIIPEIDAGPVRFQAAFDVPPEGGYAALDARTVQHQLPVFERWLRHVALGEPFERVTVEAAEVYTTAARSA